MPNSSLHTVLPPNYLADCDGFLDGHFERFGEDARSSGAKLVEPEEPWFSWPAHVTPSGYTLYLHPRFPLPPRSLVVRLADHTRLTWYLYGQMLDGRIVLTVLRHDDLPVGYAMGKIPWKPFQWNWQGCLRSALLLAFSLALLILFAGLILTYSS